MADAELFTPPDPLIGITLKDLYKIERRIGRGGMGAVYEATQINLGRSVAIKILSPLMVAEEDALKRFQREARLLGQLNHPNIVGILDSGVAASGLRYIVMEYLKGQTLRQAVPPDQGLPLDALLDGFAQICGAVGAAHQMRLVHRDLKPDNIVIAEMAGGRRVVKVLDFGIARGLDEDATRLTMANAAVGTPGYLAPEQLRDASSVDERCDIYALGAVLYFMICGQPPYRGKTMESILQMQMAGIPVAIDWDKVSAPRALDEVVRTAMQRETADRYQSVGEMLIATYRACGMEPPTTTATPVTIPRTSLTIKMPAARRRALPVLIAAIAILVGGGTWWLATRGGTKSRPPWSFRGVADAKIRFGMSGAFSGPAKELGREMKLGIDTYFRYANEELGGVHGRALELFVLDDGYEPERAQGNVTRFLESDGVFAMIGNIGTPTAAVTVPFAVKNRFLMFGAFTGAGLLRRDPPDRYVFNYRASYEQETSAMAGYFLDVLKFPPASIMVFAQNDAYGDSGFDGVARTLRQRAGIDAKDIARVRYDRNTGRVEEAVKQTLDRRGQVRAIIMVATYLPAAKYIAELRKAGVSAVCANVSFVGSRPLADEFINNYGVELAEGVIVTQVVPHVESNATGVLRFREHLKRYFPSESPSFVTLEGYAAAAALVEGVRRAGWQLDTERLIDALEHIDSLDPGLGTVLKFGPSRHQGSDRVWGTVLDRAARYQELKLD